MLFAFSLGSDGFGPDRFTLYLPFSLSAGREISSIDSAVVHQVGGVQLRLERLVNFYALTAESFQTEKAAEDFFPKLRSALLWASLKETMGISYPTELTSVTLYQTPIPIVAQGIQTAAYRERGWEVLEGNYPADKAVILPEQKKLVREEVGRPTVVSGIGSGHFANRISEALSFRAPENALNDRKLELAIHLYAGSFFEASENAQFIRLVTVLEALTRDYEIPSVASQVLNSLQKLAKEQRDKYPAHSGEWNDLEHLLSRIGGLKQQAIGTAMGQHVGVVVREAGNLGNPDEVSDKLRESYACRSQLLHDGYTDEQALRGASRFLREFIPRLLAHLYVSKVG